MKYTVYDGTEEMDNTSGMLIESQGAASETNVSGLKPPKYPFQDAVEALRPVPGAPSIAIQTTGSLWRRLWFVVSCVPRYLISGSVKVP